MRPAAKRLLASLLVLGLATGQVMFEVDPAGGPDDLEAAVAAAFAAWEDLQNQPTFESTEDGGDAAEGEDAANAADEASELEQPEAEAAEETTGGQATETDSAETDGTEADSTEADSTETESAETNDTEAGSTEPADTDLSNADAADTEATESETDVEDESSTPGAEGANETAETGGESAAVFSYGDETAYGADILSLTLVEAEEPLSVLVNPDLEDARLERVLLHEAGLVLGLSVAAEGVMNPAVAEAEVVLGDLERSALESQVNAVPEDINADGVVDFYDLNALARSFGSEGFNDRADIDGDGDVDRDDVELLKAAYTFDDPSETDPNEVTPSDGGLDGENPARSPDDLTPVDAPIDDPAGEEAGMQDEPDEPTAEDAENPATETDETEPGANEETAESEDSASDNSEPDGPEVEGDDETDDGEPSGGETGDGGTDNATDDGQGDETEDGAENDQP